MADDTLKMEPIPVTIVHSDIGDVNRVEQLAPDSGTMRSIILVGSAADSGPGAQQLLPQEPKRHRAVIQINPGNASNTLGYVLIGTRGQVQNGNGGIWVNGNSVVLESQSEYWIASDGSHSLTVTILEERFR